MLKMIESGTLKFFLNSQNFFHKRLRAHLCFLCVLPSLTLDTNKNQSLHFMLLVNPQ